MSENKQVIEDINEDVKVVDKGKNAKKKEKKYLAINKNNYPYDLHIGSACFRLEPRNKDGDSVEITEEQKSHPDLKTCERKVMIKEAK